MGIDLSDGYLAIVREKYAAPNIKYVKADIRNIPVEYWFDAAKNLFTSF